MTENTVQKIGRYEIEREIGRGGMAIVYKAHDPHLNRTVALKLIRKSNFTLDQLETLPERFKREAWALARLNHPNIVQVYDYGYYEDMPFLVMEYLEGTTLKEVRKPLKVAAAVRILCPIAEALDYVHSQGLLHRDIKPSNIMITQDGEKVYLTDFGIAKFLDDSPDQHTLTGTGVGIGTPEYMAPEQGLGRAIDTRSDQYALSVVFYELIAGHKPFTGDTPVAILTKQAIEPFPDPREYVPDLNKSVKRFFDRALAKNPADRYESMSDYLRDLDGLRLQSMSAKAGGTTLTGIPAVKADPQGSASTGSSVWVGTTDMRRIREAAGEKPDSEMPESVKSASAKRVPWSALIFGLVTLAVVIGAFFGLQNRRVDSSAQTMTALSVQILQQTADAGAATASVERKTATEAEARANATGTAEAEQRAVQGTFEAEMQETKLSATYTALAAEAQAAQAAEARAIAQSQTESAQQTKWVIDETRQANATETALVATENFHVTQTAMQAMTATQMAKYQVGNNIKFGRYEQDNDLSNGTEDIEWRILDIDGDTALVLSVMGLDAKRYHDPGGSVTWKDCTLRKWLNSEFYNNAFNDSEREKIKLTYLVNKNYPEFNIRNEVDTEDYIFLLSIAEVDEFFSYENNNDYIVKVTKYAIANDAWSSSGCGWWWLRSPYGVISDISGVDYIHGSVRPALRIKLSD